MLRKRRAKSGMRGEFLVASGVTLDKLRSFTIWRDGELRRGAGASISIWDHGLLYGDGIFEGVRLRSGLLYRLPLHLARLRRSARILQLAVEVSDGELAQAIAAVCHANDLPDAHIRVIVTRGVGLPGIDPRRCPQSSLLILAYPFPPVLGDRPIRLLTSSVVRKAPRSVDAHVKSLNYLDAVLAKQQANAGGFDDALMLDAEGMVAEATGANVFLVRQGALVTPECTAALPGITRQTVMELAMVMGVSTEVRRVTLGDVYLADEAFLTGTGAGIVPIASVDGRLISEAPGRITTKLIKAYRASWASPEFTTSLPASSSEPRTSSASG